MSHRIDILQLVAGSCVLDLRGVTVEPRGPDHLQSFGRVLRAQLGDDWRLGFAVSAPMCPEEEQHRRSLQRSSRWQRRPQELIRLQRRWNAPLKREQIQILLNAVMNRSISVRLQRGL